MTSKTDSYKVSSLDDVKTSQVENNAAKTIALDHLGVIAARIRSTTLKFQPSQTNGVSKSEASLRPLDEVKRHEIPLLYLLTLSLQIISSLDIEALEKLLSTHQDVTSNLCKRSSEDQAFDVRCIILSESNFHLNILQSARELTAATWGRELAFALKEMNIRIQDPEEQALGSKADVQRTLTFGVRIKQTLRNIWTDPAGDVFDVGLGVPVFNSSTH